MASLDKSGVTVVTQTQVQPGKDGAFAAWQDRIGDIVAGFPGFLGQTVIRPNPPAQVDWVVLQRFVDSAAAQGWLHSERRQALVDEIQPILVGIDDIHLVHDERDLAAEPVSAVIVTKVKPGCEKQYEAWEHKIAAAQSKAKGFQGYRFEAPMPGEQEDYLAILRFDTEANLQAWLDSPVRRKLIEEAEPLTVEFHARIARTGFDQWFTVGSVAGQPPAAWKQNMLVVLLLYPVVFLFGRWVQAPLLMGQAGMPFWLALFIGNVFSVLVLSKLVPLVSGRFGWWLRPAAVGRWTTDLAGTLLVVALYTATMVVFWLYK